ADMEEMLYQGLSQQAGLSESEIREYVSAMSDNDLSKLFTQIAQEQFRTQYAAQVQEEMNSMSTQQLSAALDMMMERYTTEQCASYYDEVLIFSESSYEDNLQKLGYVDLDNPSSINIYASSFENKEVIEQAIADYNAEDDDLEQIQ